MFTKLLAKLGLRKQGETALSAVVIRKNGTVEDLGVISRGKITFEAKKG
jgi:hypothetical protein